MAKSFDTELAALELLRSASAAESESPLRKALSHKNNFLVAKAAQLAAALNLHSLTPELVEAFPRFMKDPVKSDPQCWAKNAIAKALAGFEYQEPDLFLSGMAHIQLEPVWGGSSDTAGTLRSQCAFGLVQCRSLSNTQVLTHLLSLFADKETQVRANAARAVEQVGTDAAALLLRLRAELGSDEAEVLGACYSGVLHLEGSGAIPWATRFLRPHAPDDASSEAAFAIAETRTEAAFCALQAAWKQTRDPDFRGTLLTAVALTRQEAAYDFLLAEAADGSRTACEALESSAPPEEILTRLRAIPR
jgi:HEAT repeat protein